MDLSHLPTKPTPPTLFYGPKSGLPACSVTQMHAETPPSAEMLPRTEQEMERSSDSEEEKSDDSEEGVSTKSSGRAAFEEARDLARAISDVNPYNVKHGQTKTAWCDVLKKLNERKIFLGRKSIYLQTRIKELIAFKEDPPLAESGAIKKNKFGLDDNALISLAGILEKIADCIEQERSRKDNKSVAVEKKRKAEQEDERRGRAIRKIAMLGSVNAQVANSILKEVSSTDTGTGISDGALTEKVNHAHRKRERQKRPQRLVRDNNNDVIPLAAINTSQNSNTSLFSTTPLPQTHIQSPTNHHATSRSQKTYNTLAIAQLPSVFFDLTREREEKREAKIHAIETRLSGIEAGVKEIVSILGDIREQFRISREFNKSATLPDQNNITE